MSECAMITGAPGTWIELDLPGTGQGLVHAPGDVFESVDPATGEFVGELG